MKKLFSFLVVALVSTAMSYGQSTLVATLSHEGVISTFYTASALKDAYEAAVDGDIITLSSGTFTSVNISKSLTIRGAGMEPNTATGSLPTIISGDFTIQRECGMLMLEGIYHNSNLYCDNDNASIIKSRFKNILYAQLRRGMQNYSFINCRISALLRITEGASISCTNCIVNYPENKSSRSSFDFTNCIVCRGNWGGQDFYNASMKNCIYIENGLKSSLDPSHSLYNTVCVYTAQNEVDLLANSTNGTNAVVEGYSNVFATYSTFTGEFPDSESFELTDNAKATYKGLDGTQVGIYGGTLPYDPTPSGPQIAKCNVASKSTADGKLSVDIEVKSY